MSQTGPKSRDLFGPRCTCVSCFLPPCGYISMEFGQNTCEIYFDNSARLKNILSSLFNHKNASDDDRMERPCRLYGAEWHVDR